VEVITEADIERFAKKFPDAKASLSNWLEKTKSASWNTMEDVKQTFPSVSYIPKNVYCFNIQGNSYRLETTISFILQFVEILEFSTHASYGKRNKKRK
jgi:mRNA interferase HigB